MRVTNTLTGQKEEFRPEGDEVKMYVCGVTPYDECHLGHAMSYIYFDVIRRYLEFRSYTVKYAQNFTDIDDKIIARSQKLGISWKELAERHMAGYFEDMEALNIRRAYVYPRATETIPEILEMVKGLLGKGYAYELRGSVYYRIARKVDYGKLSHRTLESMMAGARVEVEEGKEHPMDFALWKAAAPGEPSWDSPWGPGRPGWHIECSAMCLKHLGETLDIHGGGQDLIFPHHENEIAQSEAFTGKPFVHYWLHNGFLQLGAEKMSKSLGNLITVKEALSRWSADAMRLFVLGSHYRSPLTFSPEALEAAERAALRLRQAMKPKGSPETPDGPPGYQAPYEQRFLQAMDDDFNTPQALAALFDLVREINRWPGSTTTLVAQNALVRLCKGVLGLTLEEPKSELSAMTLWGLFVQMGAVARKAGIMAPMPAPHPDPVFSIRHLISLRADLRKAQHWALADEIRSRLADLGVELQDTPQGATWRYQRRKSPSP